MVNSTCESNAAGANGGCVDVHYCFVQEFLLSETIIENNLGPSARALWNARVMEHV